MKRKIGLSAMVIGFAMSLAACSLSEKETARDMDHGKMSMSSNQQTKSSSMEMNHESVIPVTMKKATKPMFPVNTKVILKADHMEGMKGAKGEVVEAFDTIAYAVSFRPLSGSDEVITNHKWVVDEEITPRGAKVGDRVNIQANHMTGMMGADGAVDSAKKTVAYVVDYQPTTGGALIRDHLWMTEDELVKAE